MTNKPNKILFVDFNGVISYNHFWSEFKIEKKPFDHIFGTSLVNQWMRGEKTSEEINKIFAEIAGLDYELVFNSFIKDCEQIDLDQEVLSSISSKADYIKILATSNMDSFDRWTLKNNPILTEVFDYIHNSYNLKILKDDNDGQYFLDVCKYFNVDIQDCIHIDDSLKVCNVFNNLGGIAHNVTGQSNVLEALSSF
jgi:FMN phosphatase YigB (HAD superfamily)